MSVQRFGWQGAVIVWQRGQYGFDNPCECVGTKGRAVDNGDIAVGVIALVGVQIKLVSSNVGNRSVVGIMILPYSFV